MHPRRPKDLINVTVWPGDATQPEFIFPEVWACMDSCSPAWTLQVIAYNVTQYSDNALPN